MAQSCLKNLGLFLTAVPLVMTRALGMDPILDLNGVVNKLTEKMAIHAYTQTPNENTLVCGVGPAIQLLTTSTCLVIKEEDSTESLIKAEIHEGLGLPTTYQASHLLDQTVSWAQKAGVNHAHLNVVPQGCEDLVTQALNPKWAVGVKGVDLTDPESAAAQANQWAFNNTRGNIGQIAEEKDFPPTVAHIFLSSLFVSAKWKHSADKTAMKFYGKNGSKIIKGFKDTQEVAVFESPSYQANPFKILNILANNDLYLAIKMYDDGSVAPITVEEFNKPADFCMAKIKVPFFNFSKGLDLTFLKETFPTLFSAEYQTTLTSQPASIGVFKQENFMDVDAAGYKAGSVTMKVEHYLGLPPTPQMTIKIDKPFSFIAFQKTRSDKSKAENYLHLFSGTVVDFPEKASEKLTRKFVQQAGWEVEELERNLRSLEAQEKKLMEQIAGKKTEHEEARQSLGWGY